MPTPLPPETKVDPRRYFESAEERRGDYAARLPVCVYLETTNRCNLLCTTCPRTYAELEPPADMSWALFTSIVDQVLLKPMRIEEIVAAVRPTPDVSPVG